MNSEETSNITQNWTTPSLTTILFQHQLSTGQNMFRKTINIGVAILICCGVGFRLCTIQSRLEVNSCYHFEILLEGTITANGKIPFDNVFSMQGH